MILFQSGLDERGQLLEATMIVSDTDEDQDDYLGADECRKAGLES
jgi:hypothetical protein